MDEIISGEQLMNTLTHAYLFGTIVMGLLFQAAVLATVYVKTKDALTDWWVYHTNADRPSAF